jgi:hypothetical protein
MLAVLPLSQPTSSNSYMNITNSTSSNGSTIKGFPLLENSRILAGPIVASQRDQEPPTPNSLIEEKCQTTQPTETPFTVKEAAEFARMGACLIALPPEEGPWKDPVFGNGN